MVLPGVDPQIPEATLVYKMWFQCRLGLACLVGTWLDFLLPLLRAKEKPAWPWLQL